LPEQRGQGLLFAFVERAEEMGADRGGVYADGCADLVGVQHGNDPTKVTVPGLDNIGYPTLDRENP
jgi:hypothetical protein